MKEYFISKDTTLSGFGKTNGYYHLLIDFIIPLFVHSQDDDILLHVANRRLDPTFDEPVKPGVMPVERVKHILNQVFGDRLKIVNNTSNKHCGQIWLTKQQKEQLPLSKVIQNVDKWWRTDFDNTPGHRGIWGEYSRQHYDYFRDSMCKMFDIQIDSKKYTTIIKRSCDPGTIQRGVNIPHDVTERVQQVFEGEHPCRVVQFEKLTFQETIKTCLETSTLVGQHGAGLANCVFMQPGSKIIEYGPFKLPCYHVLADSCGLQYDRTCLNDQVIDIKQ